MTDQTIKAIPTRYAGCHFRSRLEARWAVFFDHLGIRWSYELDGYETPAGRYLPDFYLSEMDIYVEVKGSDAALQADAARITACIDFGATPLSQSGLLILGDVPRGDGWCYSHSFLDWRKGVQHHLVTFFYSSSFFWYGMGPPDPYSSSFAETESSAPDLPPETSTVAWEWTQPTFRNRLGLRACRAPSHYHEINTAYGAARSARFEHGEQPAPPPARSAGRTALGGRARRAVNP